MKPALLLLLLATTVSAADVEAPAPAAGLKDGTLVVTLSSPAIASQIPQWEQELSCGAACMNLLAAAHAMGFVGGWLTGWPSYSDAVRNAFGRAHERIAGFIFIGSPSRDLEERPRPAFDDKVERWNPVP